MVNNTPVCKMIRSILGCRQLLQPSVSGAWTSLSNTIGMSRPCISRCFARKRPSPGLGAKADKGEDKTLLKSISERPEDDDVYVIPPELRAKTKLIKDLTPEEKESAESVESEPVGKKKRSKSKVAPNSNATSQPTEADGEGEMAEDQPQKKPTIQEILQQYRLKNPSTKKNRKQRQEDIQQELEQMLQQSDLATFNQQTISDIVDRYYKEHRSQLSVEAKSTIAMLDRDKEKELKSKFDQPSEMELIEQDIQDLEFKPNFSEVSNVFKSGDGPDPLPLKVQSKLEAKRIATNYLLSEDVAELLVKEHVFLKKKEEEINAKLEEKRMRMMKIKQVKKQLDLIKKREFEIKEDEYDHIRNLIQKKSKEQTMGIIEPSKKLAQKQTKSEKAFQIYRTQTEKRVLIFLQTKLNEHSDLTQNYLCGFSIEIDQLKLNDGISVVEVFWNFQQEPAVDVEDYKNELLQSAVQNYDLPVVVSKNQSVVDVKKKKLELTDRISSNLENWSKHKLSFVMMRELGFKKQIEFRFYYSDILKQEVLLEDQMKDTIAQTVMEEVKTDIESGVLKPYQVTTEMIQTMFEQRMAKLSLKFQPNLSTAREARDARLNKLEGKLEPQTSNKEASLKKKGKKQEKPRLRDLKKQKKESAKGAKAGRDNRNPDGSRKKYMRPNAAGDFWASLED